MRRPIFVRPLTAEEHAALTAALRSGEAFVLRRAQIVLASARGERAPQIAQHLGCDDQTVREVIRAFDATGLAVLTRHSQRPHTTHPAFTPAGCERLQALLHQSPRAFGKDTSLWTLALVAEVSVAEVSVAEGLTATRVSAETIRATLVRLAVRWQRAKQWIESPDPQYIRKKRSAIAGFVSLRHTRRGHGASRTRPGGVGWRAPRCRRGATTASPSIWSSRRLVEQAVARNDPDPKALACYGLLVRQQASPEPLRERFWLRFVDGRPVSAVTTACLAWSCPRLETAGISVLVLVWDNAAWHVSAEVRAWIRAHNHTVKQAGHGVRLLRCYLPVQSPWLNAIEPKWVHGKRRVVEPGALLTAAALEARVDAAYGCPPESRLTIPEKVA